MRSAAVIFGALLSAACSSVGSTGASDIEDSGATVGEAGGADASESPASDGATPTNDATAPPADGAMPSMRIDLAQTSTSGLSSGAFMAVQFQVAFSSIMKGAAIFAGGPFDCAQGSVTTALTTCADPASPLDVAPLVATTRQWALSGDIDDPSYLAGQRVFLFGGADDAVVSPTVMDALDAYYGAFLPAASIAYESRHAGAGHTFPTLTYGGVCAASVAPWIGACDYDGAGRALAQIYGTLNPPATTLGGAYVAIAQGSYIDAPSSHSLADTAYAYVPIGCANGDVCRVHVAFHGCDQEATGAVGAAFYEHAGYNEWADTNDLVVLYPQTLATPSTNPQACWDFWGYDSADYAKKSGPQMAMVRAMLDGLASSADF